jgi:demethylmacrocin O-methyltransferase
MTLTEIASSNSSDKERSHKYFSLFYEKELSKYENEKISLLEIGIYYGDSLLIWNKFFKNCNIYAVDIEDKITEENRKFLSEKNINLFFNDAYDENFSKQLGEFDILIDDGPHTEESQLKFLKLYCDKIKKDGVLIIEDILVPESSTKFTELVQNDFNHLSCEFLDLRNKGASKPDNMLFIVRN